MYSVSPLIIILTLNNYLNAPHQASTKDVAFEGRTAYAFDMADRCADKSFAYDAVSINHE